jgi:hypothetical protein
MSRKTNLQGETKSKFLALEYKNVNFIGSGNVSKKYFTTITLDDHEVLSFVDLGSQCSLITESLARKLNVELAPLKVPVLLSTLGDFIIKPKFSVVVRMVVDGISKMVEFYVIQKCVMNLDVLIGHNFTELDDIQYTKAGNSLKFTQSNQHKSINSVETTLVNVGVDKPEVVHKVLDLLNDYSTCLASKLVEVGKANTKPMKIELLSKVPVTCHPRCFAETERQEIREIVDELLRNKIIQESNSPYASPVLLVKKKNGESRLCVDYRQLNNITVKDRYPLPQIEDQLMRLSGFKYFSSLDLFAGYHQVPMSEESVPYTAFVTQDGQYEYLRMPFGLCNAPAVFQRMMNNVLGQHRFTKVLCYLDDLLIPATTLEESLAVLRETLEMLRTAGLTLKLSKCYFLRTTIEYLGYVISEAGVQPSNLKIDAVDNFPTPQNVHQVRQFLGLTGYFRKLKLKSTPLRQNR